MYTYKLALCIQLMLCQKKEKEKHLVNHVARVRGYGPAMHTATRHLEERLTTSFDQMYFLDSK